MSDIIIRPGLTVDLQIRNRKSVSGCKSGRECMPKGWFPTSAAKGTRWWLKHSHVVYCSIPAIFRTICLEVLRIFVYLQTDELVSPSLTLRMR